MQMIKIIKKKFFNADGSINAKVLTGAVAALLLVIQSALAAFKIEFHGDWGQIQGLVNAILAFLAIVGVAENTDEGDVNHD
ncbi:hypothetical protein [Periweissella ghanensis]|nr:hypothetical protein [Periweissella ghanensis]